MMQDILIWQLELIIEPLLTQKQVNSQLRMQVDTQTTTKPFIHLDTPSLQEVTIRILQLLHLILLVEGTCLVQLITIVAQGVKKR